MAILAGDALLTYAFETAVKALDIEPQNPGIGKAIRILSAKAGIYGMVGGQTVDVESENTCDMTKENLIYLSSQDKCADRGVHDDWSCSCWGDRK